MAQADLSFLSERVQRALAADEEVLGELRRFDDEYADLQRLVRDLPNKTSHEVMVPFTDVAFFPGRLIHTNELLVLLGGDLYAERSATQTLDIIERRRDMLREKIQGAGVRVDAMGSRLGALDAVSAADGGLGVIPEEEGEDDAPGAFTTRREGRADITRKPDGTVEITETYADGETLDPIEARRASSASAAPAPAPNPDFDAMMARLEALEAGEDADPNPNHTPTTLRGIFDASTTEREMDSDDDSDYDEDAAVAAANAEANARAAAAAARRVDDAAAAVRRRAAVKNVVEERQTDAIRTDATIDITGSVTSAPAARAARPMSKFKRRAMGLEADPRDDPG
jgi:prefoldin subunit 5